MYIDFALLDIDTEETKAKEIIKEVNSYDCVNSITLPFYFCKFARAIISNSDSHKALSCIIDYPLGLSDQKTRQFAIQQAIKTGINAIDIVIPQNLACNRKYDKVREDIKNCVEICNEHSVEPRYIFEYRFFDYNCLKKLCEILESFNIKKVFPSTSFFIDNLSDNLIASVFLYQNSKNIDVLCTGNMWSDQHFKTFAKSGLFGVRLTSYNILKNFSQILNS